MDLESAMRVLGRIPSGIFILTASGDGQMTGMLASWVQQAGFDPPMVTVAVRNDRYVCQWLTDRGPFVLNFLGAEDNRLMKHFAQGFEPGEPAFDGLATQPSTNGAVVLKDAICHLECKPVRFMDSGEHRIFLAEVVGGGAESDGSPKVHIRRTGAHY